jgi:hypothetical protein
MMGKVLMLCVAWLTEGDGRVGFKSPLFVVSIDKKEVIVTF